MRWPNSIKPNTEELTPRARAYLLVLGLRHLTIGIFAIAAPHLYSSDAFSPFRSFLGIQVWGALFTLIGAHGLLIAYAGKELHARLILIASAATTGAWASGFLASAIKGNLTSPFGVVILCALTAKDWIVSGWPLRFPIIDLRTDHGDESILIIHDEVHRASGS